MNKNLEIVARSLGQMMEYEIKRYHPNGLMKRALGLPEPEHDPVREAEAEEHLREAFRIARYGCYDAEQ